MSELALRWSWLAIVPLIAACAEPPDAEIAMVRQRIERSLREHHTASFAPESTARAHAAFGEAERHMHDGDYRLAIEQAGQAAQLIDQAAAVAIAQKARIHRRALRMTRDVELHWSMLVERWPDLTANSPELDEIGSAVALLKQHIADGLPDAASLDEAWNLKQRLLRFEATTAGSRAR